MAQDSASASAPRCLSVWLAATTGAVTVVFWLAPDLVRAGTAVRTGDLGSTAFDDLLTWLAALVLAGCAGWLWFLTSFVVASAYRGHDPSRPVRGCPATVSRLVLGACGVALVGSLAAPAQAVPTTVNEEAPAPASSRVLVGLPLPERPVSDSPERPVTDSPGRPRQRVTVGAGDTLWGIARDSLPERATDAEISARWQQIYRANRAVVGTDPDLVHPGQSLRLPGAGEE